MTGLEEIMEISSPFTLSFSFNALNSFEICDWMRLGEEFIWDLYDWKGKVGGLMKK